MPNNIIIIGAGVIGAASALVLQQEGHDVTLIDRNVPCAGASFGNAGAIVNGSCTPTAMPGIVSDVVHMLYQTNSPFSIRPSYLPKILPWLLRFARQSRVSNVDENATNLHALSQHAAQSWRQIIENTELDRYLKESGWLKVYESEKTFDKTLKSRELLDQLGVQYEILSSEQIRDLEPNLATHFKLGFYQNDSLSITNPQHLVQAMVDLMISRGGRYSQFGVDKISIVDQSVILRGPNGKLTSEKVIIAAGAWSRSLAKQLGDSIPLDTERGYHLMLPESSRSLLNRPVVNGDKAFVLSPMEDGIRLTSQVEIGGLDLPPDYQHIRNLLPLVKQMLPKAEIDEQSVWMGFRPSLPDSLPVLGFAKHSNRVIYAFGHQHLGMTLGAITGLIVSDLVNERETRVPIAPYRANRF